MSYEVVTDDLRAHVSHIEGLVERVQTAMQAAQSVSMDDEAYGLICAFLPAIIKPMQEKGAQAITDTSNALSTTADNVNTAIAAYEDQEQATAQPFTSTLDTEGTGPLVGSGGPGDYVTGGPDPYYQGEPDPYYAGGPGPLMTGGPGPVMTGGPGPVVTGGPGPVVTGGPGPVVTGGPVAPDPYYQGTPIGWSAQQPFVPNATIAPLAQSLPAEMPSTPAMPVDQPAAQPFLANAPMAAHAPEPFQSVNAFPTHETTAPAQATPDIAPRLASVQPSLPDVGPLRSAVEGYSRAAPLEPALEPTMEARRVSN